MLCIINVYEGIKADRWARDQKGSPFPSHATDGIPRLGSLYLSLNEDLLG